jgi:CDP-paratose 2-epimerase
VRDLLWVDDLVEAYVRAIECKDRVAGRAYNIGGGPGFRLSLKELIAMLERRLGRTIEISHADSRLGDQRVFYCDVSRAKAELGWEPRVSPEQGVERLLSWIAAEREEIARFLSRKGVVLSRR